MQDVQAEGVMMRGWASMCPCKWASMCPCKWASMCPCKWASMCPCKWASMCPCKWASMCLCEWACVCASGQVSVRVGMCLCEWACVRASEMGRCDNHEGVGIHVGGQDISVWGNAGGHRCNEGEGECIHVGGSRWHPCENMQVGMDVMSARGHMAMQVRQGGTHAGTCRPAAGGNPWMWVGCMLSMVGVNMVRCCYIIFPPKFRPYSMDPELIMWPRADQGAGYEGRMDRGEKRVCRVWQRTFVIVT